METDDTIVLVCPPWPGRDPFLDVRKVSCADCKCDVSVSTFNLPLIKRLNVRVMCESCVEIKKASLPPEEWKDVGVNLPGSGRERPFPEQD